MYLKIPIIVTSLVLSATYVIASPVLAQTINHPESNIPHEETLEAKVVDILEEKEVETAEGKRLYQKIELEITKDSLEDSKILVENGAIYYIYRCSCSRDKCQ